MIRTVATLTMLSGLLSACSTLDTDVPSSQRPALASSPLTPGPLVNLAQETAPGSPLIDWRSSDPAHWVMPKPIDPLEPEQVIDPLAPAAQADLWQRIRLGFGMADLDSSLVRDREFFYAGKPENFRRMTERGSRYLYHVIEEIEKRGLPSELALLPFVESAFNPQAMSTAKASGMWQFIPTTGRDYALKQNAFRDDRRDVLASTRAALDYLTRLYGLFNDWHLALAAYNWGEGNVQRAINRNQRAGLPTDYASLRMPDETRHYVPKLLALKNIIAQPQAYAVELPPLKNHPYFLSVPIDRDMDVELAARLAGVSLDEFKQLNPQMNRPVILAAGTEQVLLPYDNANQFAENLRTHRGPLASWTAWVAPRSLSPAEAARLVGTSESELRDVNRIPPRMLVTAGSALLVPRTPAMAADVSGELADNAHFGLTPERQAQRRLTIRVGRGDSLASIGRRYGATAAQVASWNKMSPSSNLKSGSSLVVYTTPAVATPTRVASQRNTGGSRNNSRTAPRPATKPSVRVAQR